MASLSLLSRGTGQVIRKTQEKLEVHFSPEDYLKWKKAPGLQCHINRSRNNCQAVERGWELYVPKTYSTRRGALVLYSEDLAKPLRKLKGCRKSQGRFGKKSRILHIELRTLQDLVRAVLEYGGKKRRMDQKGLVRQPYLGFLSNPDSQSGRQMRPGYSAKRYLLKLIQSWEPSILQKLQRAGYIRDPFLLEEKSLDHRKKEQDLSAGPPKYKLLPVSYSTGSYTWTKTEQQTNPGVGPSSHTLSENEARLVDGSEEEKHGRRRARIPLRISVRKLSFHLRPQMLKEAIWNQAAAAYRQIPVGTWVGSQNEEEGHVQRRMPSQAGACPVLENSGLNTSELWCEKSRVTFYGGFFPGRKISSYCASVVDPRHSNIPDNSEKGLFAETSLFPPILPEQTGVRTNHRKQVPEIFKLPQISEESTRAHRKKQKSGKLPKELVILPLLVHLESEAQNKAEKPREAHYNETQTKADVCKSLLAPLVNESERKSETYQAINGVSLESRPASVYLPSICNEEFPLNATKESKKVMCAEKDHSRQRESYNGSSLGSLIVDPDRKIIRPSLLESDQTTDDPGPLGLISKEKGNGGMVSLRSRMAASVSPTETSSTVQELDQEVPSATLLYGLQEAFSAQEVENTPRKENGLENEHCIVAFDDKSTSEECRKDNQQSQEDLCGNSHRLYSRQAKGGSSFPETRSTRPTDGGDHIQDGGKRLVDLPQSESFACPEPHLAQAMISTSKMDKVLESENALMEPSGFNVEMKSSSRRRDIQSPGQQYVTEEKEEGLTSPEQASKQATDLSTDGVVLGSKPAATQKKRELAKTGTGPKGQKKNPKKDKRQKQAEFVVGKPKGETAVVGEPASRSKKEPESVNPTVSAEEAKQEAKLGAASVAVQQTPPNVEDKEGEGGEELESGASDESPSPPRPPDEEPPMPLEESEPPRAQESGQPPASHPTRASNIVHPAVSTVMPSLAAAVQSSELPEVLSENKQAAKVSRDRLIAERAEQRRLAVERKRREQEEQKREQQEQQARMERLKEEMEQERRKRFEEIRLRKQEQEAEWHLQEEEMTRKLQAEKAAQERARQQQEEYRRKLLAMQKKKQEEERERAEAEKLKQQERERWLEEERRLLAEMAEEERLEYEKRRQAAEERRRQEAEERRKKEQEEARRALEEARTHALLRARQREELEKEQHFQHLLFVEASGLERGQDISRPWVYSYFQHPFLEVGEDDL